MKRIESKKRKKRQQTASKLKTAVEILLRREGISVIAGLAENCRDGQAQSAKLLYEIARDSEDGGGFRSLAFGWDRE